MISWPDKACFAFKGIKEESFKFFLISHLRSHKNAFLQTSTDHHQQRLNEIVHLVFAINYDIKV